MKSSFLDTPESAPLVPADHLAPVQQASAPPSYHDTTSSRDYVEVQGEVIPTIQSEEERTNVTAAGVGSGVFGLLLGGPFLGLLFGFGGAFAAERKQGFVGDTARAVGEVAITIQRKAKEIDQKHNVVDKSKVAVNKAWEKAKEVDREHNILDKAKELAVYSWNNTVTFVRQHNLIERGVNGIGKGFCWLIEKVTPTSEEERATTSATTGVKPMSPPRR